MSTYFVSLSCSVIVGLVGITGSREAIIAWFVLSNALLLPVCKIKRYRYTMWTSHKATYQQMQRSTGAHYLTLAAKEINNIIAI